MKNEKIIEYAKQTGALYIKTANGFENIIHEIDWLERPVVNLFPGTEYFAVTSNVTSDFIEYENVLEQEIFGEPAEIKREYYISLGVAE